MSDREETVCIIPAKGNSTGVPGKMQKTVGGRTLVHRAIETASNTESLDRIIVSTSGDQLNKHVVQTIENHGYNRVSVFNRVGTFLSSDSAQVNHVVLFCLFALEEDYGVLPKRVVVFQPTSPFVARETINAAVKKWKLESEKHAEAVTVMSMAKLRKYVYDENGVPIMHNPRRRLGRQDANFPVLYETGGLYVTGGRETINAGTFRNGRIVPLLVDDKEAIEIDEHRDLALARTLA